MWMAVARQPLSLATRPRMSLINLVLLSSDWVSSGDYLTQAERVRTADARVDTKPLVDYSRDCGRIEIKLRSSSALRVRPELGLGNNASPPSPSATSE